MGKKKTSGLPPFHKELEKFMADYNQQFSPSPSPAEGQPTKASVDKQTLEKAYADGKAFGEYLDAEGAMPAALAEAMKGPNYNIALNKVEPLQPSHPLYIGNNPKYYVSGKAQGKASFNQSDEELIKQIGAAMKYPTPHKLVLNPKDFPIITQEKADLSFSEAELKVFAQLYPGDKYKGLKAEIVKLQELIGKQKILSPGSHLKVSNVKTNKDGTFSADVHLPIPVSYIPIQVLVTEPAPLPPTPKIWEETWHLNKGVTHWGWDLLGPDGKSYEIVAEKFGTKVQDIIEAAIKTMKVVNYKAIITNFVVSPYQNSPSCFSMKVEWRSFMEEPKGTVSGKLSSYGYDQQNVPKEIGQNPCKEIYLEGNQYAQQQLLAAQATAKAMNFAQTFGSSAKELNEELKHGWVKQHINAEWVDEPAPLLPKGKAFSKCVVCGEPGGSCKHTGGAGAKLAAKQVYASKFKKSLLMPSPNAWPVDEKFTATLKDLQEQMAKAVQVPSHYMVHDGLSYMKPVWGGAKKEGDTDDLPDAYNQYNQYGDKDVAKEIVKNSADEIAKAVDASLFHEMKTGLVEKPFPSINWVSPNPTATKLSLKFILGKLDDYRTAILMNVKDPEEALKEFSGFLPVGVAPPHSSSVFMDMTEMNGYVDQLKSLDGLLNVDQKVGNPGSIFDEDGNHHGEDFLTVVDEAPDTQYEELVEVTLTGLTRKEAEHVLKNYAKSKAGPVMTSKKVRKEMGTKEPPICTWVFESSSMQFNGTPIMYTTQLNKDSTVSCNCLGWRIEKKNSDGSAKPRVCTHIKEVAIEAAEAFKNWKAGKPLGEGYEAVAPDIATASPKEMGMKLKEKKTVNSGDPSIMMAKRIIEL